MSWCCKPLGTSLDWRSQLNYEIFPVFVYNWLMFNFKCKSLLSNSWRLFAFSNFWYKLLTTFYSSPRQAQCYSILFLLTLYWFVLFAQNVFCPGHWSLFLPVPSPMALSMGEYHPHRFICALCVWPSGQCMMAAWMGGGFGGEWILPCVSMVYVWLSPFAVHPKLSHHC